MNGASRTVLALALVATASLATAAFPTTGAAASQSSAPEPVYYVAVGDSLAAGYAAPPGTGYADDLLTAYRAELPSLQLRDFGCASETTDTMLHGGICSYPEGSQLAAAEAFLRAHAGRVAVVTIDIGGNDVVGCGLNGLDVACLQRGLATVGANLRTILTGLRDAAGAGVPIVGMNYFDPFLARWLEGADGQAFARATVPLDDQVSTILAQAYSASGVPVADVEAAFETHDFSTMVTRPYGTIPRNVADVCDWLDMTCSSTGPDFLGDDANATGYAVIAGAMRAVTPPLGSIPHAIDNGVATPPVLGPAGGNDVVAPPPATDPPSSQGSPAPTLPSTGGAQAVLALGAIAAIVLGTTLARRARVSSGASRRTPGSSGPSSPGTPRTAGMRRPRGATTRRAPHR